MRCKSVRKKLLEYFEGTLSRRDSIAVDNHVHECDSCRHEMEMFGRLSSLIHKVDYPPTSIWDNFLDDLHERIDKEMAKSFVEAQKNRAYITWGWTSAAIAAVVFMIASIFIEYHIEDAKNLYIPRSQAVSRSVTTQNNEGYIIAELVSKAFIDDKRVAELKKLQEINEYGILAPTNYRYYPTIAESMTQSETETEEELQPALFDGLFEMGYMDSLEYYASESGSI